jgi:hypothetical protein
MTTAGALDAVHTRAEAARDEAASRWSAAVGSASTEPVDAWRPRFARAGRITLNLHPDRITRSGSTVAAGLLADGRYRSQWVTGISSGSRSALAGGDRHRFERKLFGGVYDGAEPRAVELPVYGSLDLLGDPFGGSPRFGSCFVVLRPGVLDRTTLCVGDSHVAPRDVGTADASWCLLAGLAEQAAAGRLLDRPLGVDALLTVLDGRRDELPRPSRSLDGYVEAQVHGGVDLTTDVEAIVVDPSFSGTEVERDLVAAATRYGFDLRRHPGSELAVDEVPTDFRGPTMPALARHVARPDGIVDANTIGGAAPRNVDELLPGGDPPDSLLQQLKYLWHTVFALGRDANPPPR